MINKYEKRGVSSNKEDVHRAISSLDKGFFPGGFCKAVPSFFDENRIALVHADGAGTKSSLAYLYWKETGDSSVFRGIAQDAFVMNLDDLLCVGALDCFHVSSTIGRNKHLISGDIISEIINGTQDCIARLKDFGCRIENMGGETADVGDVVRSLVVDSTFSTEMNKSEYIDASNIVAGLAIVGLSSDGKASYEDDYNSGIGSNGLTSARHDLLSNKYKLYTNSFDPLVSEKYVYMGDYSLTDEIGIPSLNIGKALLSPTRTYYPIVKDVLQELKKEIKGMIHCSGGGQVKCAKFSSHIKYVKDDLFNFPILFQELSKKNKMEEMFQVFNCGHRFEFYIEKKYSDIIIDISKRYNVDAKVVGYTEYSTRKENEVLIKYDKKEYYF